MDVRSAGAAIPASGSGQVFSGALGEKPRITKTGNDRGIGGEARRKRGRDDDEQNGRS